MENKNTELDLFDLIKQEETKEIAVVHTAGINFSKFKKEYGGNKTEDEWVELFKQFATLYSMQPLTVKQFKN